MSPFQSKSQARFLREIKPSIAKEFARKTISIAKLPEKKDSKKKSAVPKVA